MSAKRYLKYHRIPVIIIVLVTIWVGYEVGSDIKFHKTGVPVRQTTDMDAHKKKSTWYYPNGKKRLEGLMIDDKREGIWKIWDENGTLIQEGEYHNDKLNGKVKRWNAAGELVEEAYYENDKRVEP